MINRGYSIIIDKTSFPFSQRISKKKLTFSMIIYGLILIPFSYHRLGTTITKFQLKAISVSEIIKEGTL